MPDSVVADIRRGRRIERVGEGQADPVRGDMEFTSFGCNASDFNLGPGTGVALIQRGVCFFQDKADNAEAAGYDAYVVYNDLARGDGLIQMAPRDASPVGIVGLFYGHTRGDEMATAIAGGDTVTVELVTSIAGVVGDSEAPENREQPASIFFVGGFPMASHRLFGHE